MKISVCICTFNRSKLLSQTLTSLAALKIPSEVSLEIIVVENNCSDDTEDVLTEWSQRLPLVVLHEPIPGQTYARNLALEHASGDLILWTDDDVIVSEQWVAAYVGAAKEWPEAAYFGGRIDLLFESTPPEWVSTNVQSLQSLLVLRQLDGGLRLLAEDEEPFGANMAFRRASTEGLRFDTRIGHRGKRLFGGDDLAFVRSVRARGGQGVWVPEASVQHFVPTSRTSKEFLIKWNQDAGITQAQLQFGKEFVQFCGMPRWMVRRYCEARLALCCSYFRGKSAWLKPLADTSYYGAFLKEWRALKQKAATARSCDEVAVSA